MVPTSVQINFGGAKNLYKPIFNLTNLVKF